MGGWSQGSQIAVKKKWLWGSQITNKRALKNRLYKALQTEATGKL